MNRFTTTVTALTATLITSTFALAGPTPKETSMASARPSNASLLESANQAAELSTGPTFSTNFGPGDLNHDGYTNIDDLLMVVNAWGEYSKDKPSTSDIAPAGGDGKVNFDDMLVVLINWGA